MTHHKVRHFKGSVSEEKLRAAGILREETREMVQEQNIEHKIIMALKDRLDKILADDHDKFTAINWKIWLVGKPDNAEIIRRYQHYIDLLTAPEMDDIDVTPMGGW